MLVFLVFLFTFISGMTCAEYNCAEDPLKQCKFEITKDSIPWDDSQFSELCEKLAMYYNCSSENNITQAELCSLPLVLSKSKALVKEVCSNYSVLRNRYLVFGNCYKLAFEKKIGKCIREADEIHKLLKPFLENKDVQVKGVSGKCIKTAYIMDCYIYVISRTCGFEASADIGELLHRASSYNYGCKNREEYGKALRAIQFANYDRTIDTYTDYEEEYEG
ncbi:hypothetical protein NPIL_68371 [Nephila pilipes]|uniref:DUF19 domain-containing protein n=1 Tax=Nephila pilipes TaxID=299642 RepID=A0A8X6IPJ4_NEPPI|nr:hypothetical protein NPIL_68371 [Nephila pilipes]